MSKSLRVKDGCYLVRSRRSVPGLSIQKSAVPALSRKRPLQNLHVQGVAEN